jgi:hypothetical protein
MNMIMLPELVGAVTGLLFATGVMAQSGDYVLQPPGKPPTNLTLAPTDGGFMVQIPGRPPVHAKPNGDGSYTVDIPGRPPTTMNPRPGGGFVIQNPGRPPTYISPGG